VSEPAHSLAELRRRFEAKGQGLVGRRLTGVGYWDIHNFSDEPRVWDYGDWHHAVMGVDLTTDTGPACMLWTNTLHPYGLEVFDSPITEHLSQHPEGPEGWPVTVHPAWQARVAGPIQAVSFFWEHLTMGPATNGAGDVVAPAREIDVPVSLRLDFSAGPVWMVAGIPQFSTPPRYFVPGDEVMVVFSAKRMREVGFPDGSFTRPANA
jgi:hypothetical protein